MKRAMQVLALALLLAGCARTPPEESLRRSIDAFHHAIESRDAVALADGIAPDVIGPDGMDRKAAPRLAPVVFFRNRDIGVTVGAMDIRMQPGGARVTCTAALTGGGGGLLPTSGQVYAVTMQWRQLGDEWELVNAQWEPKL